MPNTLTTDRTGANKLFKTSGEFTSTILDSLADSNFDTQPGDADADANGDTFVSGFTGDKIYKLSGTFSTTILDSEATQGSTDPFPVGASVDENNYFVGEIWYEVYWGSGQMTSTVLSSIDLTSATNSLSGAGCDADNSWWGTNGTEGNGYGIYIMSGKVTSTYVDSLSRVGVTETSGVDGSANGTDSLVHEGSLTRMVKYSGKISSTVLDSVDDSSWVTGSHYGMGTDDFEGRLELGATGIPASKRTINSV